MNERAFIGTKLSSYKHKSALISVGNVKDKCENVCELLFWRLWNENKAMEMLPWNGLQDVESHADLIEN